MCNLQELLSAEQKAKEEVQRKHAQVRLTDKRTELLNLRLSVSMNLLSSEVENDRQCLGRSSGIEHILSCANSQTNMAGEWKKTKLNFKMPRQCKGGLLRTLLGGGHRK